MENQKQKQKQFSYKEESVEISLAELFLALKHRLWMLLLAAVVCGGIAGSFSKFVLTPQFQSTAMMYILSKETTLTSLADLQIGSQLTEDYKIMVTSRPVLEAVITKQGLDMTYENMKSKVTIGNPADTRILTVTVTDSDPLMAKNLANAIAETSSEYIGDIMEMIPPKIIEHSVVPMLKCSPSNSRNAMMGAIVGIVLVCGFVVLEVMMNDTIRSEEDVEKYLGLTVLAVVPIRSAEGKGKEYGEYDGNSRQKNAGKIHKKLRKREGEA